jgi:hypothetical protein
MAKSGSLTGLCADISYIVTPAPAEGQCTLKLIETMTCDDWDSNLLATIDLMDAAGQQIGQEANQQPINAKDPWSFSTPWGYLVITGENMPNPSSGYVQFSLGSQSWKSNNSDTTSTTFCMTTGWTNGWTVPNCNNAFSKTSNTIVGDISTVKVHN